MELKKCEPSLKENHTIIKTFKDVEYDNLNELLLMLHQQPKQAINRFFCTNMRLFAAVINNLFFRFDRRCRLSIRLYAEVVWEKCTVKTAVMGTECGREISHTPDIYECTYITYDYTVCFTIPMGTIYTTKTVMQKQHIFHKLLLQLYEHYTAIHKNCD